MQFQMAHHPCQFEIPDEWVLEAGVMSFRPKACAYRSHSAAIFVPLTEVEPPVRVMSRPRDWRGFERLRLLAHLKRFIADEETDPVPVVRLPSLEFGNSVYRYRIRDGYHRFYASIIAGFSDLPIIL